jgi:hypothetical protein
MHKNILLLAFIICISLFGFGQNQALSPSVISVAGREDKTSSISVEWSIGEPAIHLQEANEHIYSEGFHQPTIFIELIQKAPDASNFQITVAPNPVASILNVRIRSSVDSRVLLQLTDVAGKQISSETANSLSDSKDFDLSQLGSGLYLLNVISESGPIIQTFKVSKSNNH